jgi:hypothetical protein
MRAVALLDRENACFETPRVARLLSMRENFHATTIRPHAEERAKGARLEGRTLPTQRSNG